MSRRVNGHAPKHTRIIAKMYQPGCACGERSPYAVRSHQLAVEWHRQHKFAVLSTPRKETDQ